MIYRIVRILVFLIFIGIAFILIKRKKIAKNRFSIIIIIVSYSILFTGINVLPVENLFINFKSPEDVFNYYCIGKIEDVIYGEDSCMIVYSTGSSSYSHSIMPKSLTGYKIPNIFTNKIVKHNLNEYGSFTVYSVLGTNDFYIMGMTFSKDKETNIVDGRDNKVKYIEDKVDNSDTKTIILYSYVDNFTTEDYLIMNGKKIFASN